MFYLKITLNICAFLLLFNSTFAQTADAGSATPFCEGGSVTLAGSAASTLNICIFDFDGGNCGFTADACTDGFSFDPVGPQSSAPFQTTGASAVEAVEFHVYWGCNQGSWDFYLNGVLLGSGSIFNQDCGCNQTDFGTYPSTFRFSGSDVSNAYNLNSDNTLTVVSTTTDEIATMGYAATVYYTHPGATVSWSPSTGLSSTSVLNPVASPTTTTTYTLTYTDEFGNPASDDVTVTVYPTPQVSAGDDVTVCEGESATLTATSSNTTFTEATENVCIWSGSGDCATLTSGNCGMPGTIEPGYVSSAPVTLNGTGINSVAFTMYFQGTQQFYIYLNGVEVFVTPVLTDPTYNSSVCNTTFLPFTFTVPGSAFAAWNFSGSNVISVDHLYVSDRIYGYTAAVNYDWNYFSWSGNTSDPNSATTTATPSETTTYTVTLTDQTGCFASDDVTVSVRDCAPTCDLTADAGANALVYYGYAPLACATLTASAAGGTAPFSFSWSTGETTASITVCPSDTTVYTVTITDANGCEATDDVTVKALDVRCGKGEDKVAVCHVPSGNPSQAKTLCLASQAVDQHLINHSLSYVGECGTQKKGQDNDELILVKEDILTLLQVYPNPTTGYFRIIFGDAIQTINQVQITNVQGAVVKLIELPSATNQFTSEVDLSNLSEGMYFVKLMNDRQVVQFIKVLKNN